MRKMKTLCQYKHGIINILYKKILKWNYLISLIVSHMHLHFFTAKHSANPWRQGIHFNIKCRQSAFVNVKFSSVLAIMFSSLIVKYSVSSRGIFSWKCYGSNAESTMCFILSLKIHQLWVSNELNMLIFEAIGEGSMLI